MTARAPIMPGPNSWRRCRLYQEQHYPLSEMVATWAGAFGQTQFTPTTFFKYATDGDGDGKIDLWHSRARCAGLRGASCWPSRAGRRGKPWGYEVKLPPSFAYEDADTRHVESRSPNGARWASRPRRRRRCRHADDNAAHLSAGGRARPGLSGASPIST